jgi:hypothetical protein
MFIYLCVVEQQRDASQSSWKRTAMPTAEMLKGKVESIYINDTTRHQASEELRKALISAESV